jgi:hypothetical protein
MEDATSIFQLRDTNTYASERKAPLDVVSYSDVLKNLQSEEIAQVAPPQAPPQAPQAPQAPLPPTSQSHQTHHGEHPFVAFRGVSPEIPVQGRSSSGNNTEWTDNTFQNEMIILLLVYVFVHMTHVQSWLRTKVPNIVDQSGATSVLGLLMNGIAVIVIWNVSKKMVLRYMNDM